MTSSAQTGMTRITVEFTEGINVDVAANDVQQKISGIQSELPAEVKEPSYSKLDFNDVPIVNLAIVSDGEADTTRMYRIADEQIRPRLESVPGVGRAVVVGGTEPEVQVEIQPDRLRAYLLTIDNVTAAIQSQFLSASGGRAQVRPRRPGAVVLAADRFACW
jgi:hydrophobic/amphiphilic exporter-1 (mainly G- bacteria), HAE1 family